MTPPKYPLARLSPAKDEILALAITRESVMTHEIRPLLNKLAALMTTREAALQWEGKLTFYFDGWDHDPRETAEIPELRAFFLDVMAEWPYWFHFCEKVGDTVLHVLRLLCRGHYERLGPGLVGWRFVDLGDMSRQVLRLFNGMNRLYDNLDLPEEMNERISQEITQLIECSLQ